MASHSSPSFGPLTVSVIQLALQLGWPRVSALTAHLARVSALPGPAPAGIRPVITGPPGEETDCCPRVPAAFRLPAFATAAILPPPGIPPLSRSAYRQAAGCRPRTTTGYHVSAHLRYDRIGCPLCPGTSGALTGRDACQPAACRLSAPRVLHPGPAVTYPGLAITRHQRGFTRFTRPAFPLPAAPR